MKMSKPFRPMLASPADVDTIQFPVYCTPKLDGIRVLSYNGVAMSRSMKPIPNKHVQKFFETLPHGLDGELIVPGGDFNECQSAFMSIEGEPEFEYLVFDNFSVAAGYLTRTLSFHGFNLGSQVKFLYPIRHDTVEGLLNLHEHYLGLGFEGTMLRSPDGPYKQGRSGKKQGYLLKLKDFCDLEIVVTGMEPLTTNANVAEVNELGYTKRSLKKEGMVEVETLGTLIGTIVGEDTEVRVGSGFTAQERFDIWNSDPIGKLATITYQGPRNVGDALRFPVFKGFRSELDQ
jgi:DNA ligase-1